MFPTASETSGECAGIKRTICFCLFFKCAKSFRISSVQRSKIGISRDLCHERYGRLISEVPAAFFSDAIKEKYKSSRWSNFKLGEPQKSKEAENILLLDTRIRGITTLDYEQTISNRFWLKESPGR